MGFLARVVKGALGVSQSNASALSTKISTQALDISSSGLRAISNGGKESTTAMRAAIAPVMTGKITQNEAAKLSHSLGRVCGEAATLKAIQPIILNASKQWREGEQARASISKGVAGDAQKVALLNAQAQRTIRQGHVEAQILTQFEQATAQFTV